MASPNHDARLRHAATAQVVSPAFKRRASGRTAVTPLEPPLAL